MSDLHTSRRRRALWLVAALIASTGEPGAGCRQQREQPPSVGEGRPAGPRAGTGAGAGASTGTAPARLPTFDLWYRILADGQPIGYRHVTLSIGAARRGTPPELQLATVQRTRMVAGGKQSVHTLRLTERCTTHGALRRLTTERRTATDHRRRIYDIRGQTLTVTDPASGSTRQLPLATGAPVTGLCGLYLALLSGAETRVLRSLDPRTGELITGHVLRRPGSKDTYRYSESHRPKVRTDLVLGPSRLPIRQTVHGLGMTLRLTLSSRAEALGLFTKPPSKAAQEMAIDLGARLPEPLEARRIRYALSLPRKLPPAALLELGRANQRRLPGADPTHLIIDVRRVGPLPPAAAATPYPIPAAQLRPVAAYVTHPNPALDARDTRRAHVAALLRGERTALRAALRLTAWASIARTRGLPDRASLLVAALRAARIPARLAFGFLYVGSVMTEHRWVEAHLGTWIGLDPETGGTAGATHLRLVTSHADPRRAPDADWRLLRPDLAGLRARLVEAELASGFRFVPGAQANAHQVANVLYQRVWSLVVRRPLAARYVVGGAKDPYELAVISTDAAARLELQLYAASPDGLDPRAFLNMGYRPRRIGLRDYLVKDLKAKPAADKPVANKPVANKPVANKKAATKPAANKPVANKKAATKPAPAGVTTGATTGATATLRRSYVQIACSTKPWGARLVRWTLTARGAKPAQITALENKTLGTFQMTGHPAAARACTNTPKRKPTR